MKDNETDLTHTTNDGQPIGTGAGVLSGAATGAAMGAAGGPVGAVVGGAVGAVTGGLMGKGIEKAAQNATDRAVHDAYWQENHAAPAVREPGFLRELQDRVPDRLRGRQKTRIETDFAELEPIWRPITPAAIPAAAWNWSTPAPPSARVTSAPPRILRLILHEEELKVGKREVAAGQVEIRKVVHTKTFQVPVELRREDVTIERVSAGELGGVVADDAFDREGNLRHPAQRGGRGRRNRRHHRRGRAFTKPPRVETQNVSETLRKEDVEVVRDGKTEVHHDETTTKH